MKSDLVLLCWDKQIWQDAAAYLCGARRPSFSCAHWHVVKLQGGNVLLSLGRLDIESVSSFQDKEAGSCLLYLLGGAT